MVSLPCFRIGKALSSNLGPETSYKLEVCKPLIYLAILWSLAVLEGHELV